VRWALEAGCVAGMRKLFGRGFADRTNEGHGLRLAALHINVDPLTKIGRPIFSGPKLLEVLVRAPLPGDDDGAVAVEH
jgi:hypothetical protein